MQATVASNPRRRLSGRATGNAVMLLAAVISVVLLWRRQHDTDNRLRMLTRYLDEDRHLKRLLGQPSGRVVDELPADSATRSRLRTANTLALAVLDLGACAVCASDISRWQRAAQALPSVEIAIVAVGVGDQSVRDLANSWPGVTIVADSVRQFWLSRGVSRTSGRGLRLLAVGGKIVMVSTGPDQDFDGAPEMLIHMLRSLSEQEVTKRAKRG